MPSRWSSGNSPTNQHQRYPNHSRGGGKNSSGGGRHQRYRGPQEYPTGGGGPGFRVRPGGFGHNQMAMGGQSRGERGFPGFGRRGSPPDNTDGNNFAKLFVGSVPRTATEDDIRPLFEEHGDVIEVALIKDRRSGH